MLYDYVLLERYTKSIVCIKVFGMRQLSRRKHKQHRDSGDPSIINISTHDERKLPSTNTRPARASHSYSGSSAVLLGGPGMPTGVPGTMDFSSQSNHHHTGSGSTGFTPTTPGATGNFPYMGAAAGPPLVLDTGVTAVPDPYYRPPRAKGGTYGPKNPGGGSGSDSYSPGARSRGSSGSEMWGVANATGGAQRSSQGSLPNGPEDLWNQGPGPASGTGTPQGGVGGSGGLPGPLAHRHTDSSLTAGSVRNSAPIDYAVREMDGYYGVRGPALGGQPGRRLGTGPADPTGPVAVTKGWLWKRLGWGFGGKKERGFTVVRSSRAPEELQDAEREAKGIGMAVTSQTPPVPGESDDSDSDSEDDAGDVEEAGKRSNRQRRRKTPSPIGHLTGHSNSRRKSLSLISQNTDSDSEGDGGGEAVGPSSRMLEKQPAAAYDGSNNIELRHQGSIKPQVPRKSSKRKSVTYLMPLNSNPPVNHYSPPQQSPQQQQLLQSTSPPGSPIQARLLHHPYDPPPLRPSLHPRHPQYDTRNLTPAHHNSSPSGRLPFTAASSTQEGQESTHTRSISTSSSLLPPPPEITADDNALSRPPSVGTVHRYRMEDSLRNSDVVEGGRSGSLVSEGGGGWKGEGGWR